MVEKNVSILSSNNAKTQDSALKKLKMMWKGKNKKGKRRKKDWVTSRFFFYYYLATSQKKSLHCTINKTWFTQACFQKIQVEINYVYLKLLQSQKSADPLQPGLAQLNLNSKCKSWKIPKTDWNSMTKLCNEIVTFEAPNRKNGFSCKFEDF